MLVLWHQPWLCYDSILTLIWQAVNASSVRWWRLMICFELHETRKYYPSRSRDPPTYTHQPSMQQKVPFSLIRCSSSKVAFCRCVEWGWHIYNIVESESDPLTRRAVDLFEKEPLKGNSEVHLHTPTKFGEDRSKDLGGDREQTDRQTNRQTDKRCSIYSMMYCHGLKVMSSNPSRVELGVLGTSVLSCTWTKKTTTNNAEKSKFMSWFEHKTSQSPWAMHCDWNNEASTLAYGTSEVIFHSNFLVACWWTLG